MNPVEFGFRGQKRRREQSFLVLLVPKKNVFLPLGFFHD
jgi:hypothetical protein